MDIQHCFRARVVGGLVLCSLGALPLAGAEKSPQKVLGEVKPDQALVYLLREGHMLAAAVTVFAYADQQFIGTLKSNSYTFAYLPPGTFLLWAHPLAFTETNTRVKLEAGKTYYLEQKVTMGVLKARNKLVRLEDADGRAKLLKCALSSETAAEPAPAATPAPVTK